MHSCFLAAMSSSRSDDVTNFVCVCVCVSVLNLLSLEHSKHLKPYVSVVSQESLKCLKGVPRLFQGCLKVSQGCFLRNLEGVSRVI